MFNALGGLTAISDVTGDMTASANMLGGFIAISGVFGGFTDWVIFAPYAAG
ncbi:MAG: hypothetical protein ABR907_14790 [Terracidiphilus sp.]